MLLTIYKDYNELSAHVASEIIALINNKPEAVLCFASGDTPRLSCQLLAARAIKEKTDFSQCTFIGLDEWLGIPPENEGSCRFFFESLLLKPLNFSTSQILLFDAMSNNPLQECQKMDELILAKGGIDLMIVGVGMNGHIGFNEPGVSFNNYSHVIDLDDSTISVGQKYFNGPVQLKQGITLGLKHLLESKKVLLIANGAKKAEVIKKTIESEINNMFPATIIRNHPQGIVMVDETAATLLTR